MIGFNGQEGLYDALSVLIPNITQHPIDNGISKDTLNTVLTAFCTSVTPLSVNLCLHFYMNAYGFNTITDDKQRLIQLSDVFGKLYSNKYYIGL